MDVRMGSTRRATWSCRQNHRYDGVQTDRRKILRSGYGGVRTLRCVHGEGIDRVPEGKQGDDAADDRQPWIYVYADGDSWRRPWRLIQCLLRQRAIHLPEQDDSHQARPASRVAGQLQGGDHRIGRWGPVPELRQPVVAETRGGSAES